MIDGLIIDSFAGGGGASLGIEMALGRSPDIAINHDPEALAMHKANHPNTLHLSKNIWKVDPLDYVGRQKVALAWFSPDCKHFSKAKGGKPVSRNIRDLAWVVVLWAERAKPNVIILENVEEFTTWGPLTEDDMPDLDRKGETFNLWCRKLKKLGYKIEWKFLRACDYGAPTIRKRLFLIARRDGLPIVWPKPTHGPGLIPYRTAAECIDWSIPCHSIFLTKEEGSAVGVKRPLAEATMARIAKGVKRYVIDAAEPFIVNFTHQGGDRNESLGDPLKTVTGARRGEKGLIVPVLSYAQQGGASRPADSPFHTITASGKDQNQIIAAHLQAYYGAGNGGQDRSANLDDPLKTVTTENRHALVSAFLAQHNTGVVGRGADVPLSTVTQTGSHQQLVAAHMLHMKGSQQSARGADEPLASITAQGTHHAEVRAFLMKYYGTDQDPQLREPMHTVTTKDRFGLVMVHGEPYQIVDITMRMLSPRELFRAQGFPDSYKIEVMHEGKVLSKTSQIGRCGNSVSPVMAKALASAQFGIDAEKVAA